MNLKVFIGITEFRPIYSFNKIEDSNKHLKNYKNLFKTNLVGLNYIDNGENISEINQYSKIQNTNGIIKTEEESKMKSLNDKI